MDEARPEKKLPPYAGELAAARRRGMVPARQDLAHVVIAFEWRRECAPDYPVIVLPPGADPAGFDWHFVRGLDVLIMCRDADTPRVVPLARELFQARAAGIFALNMDRVARGEPRAFIRLVPLWELPHGS